MTLTKLVVPMGFKCKVCHAKENHVHKMDCHPPHEYVPVSKSGESRGQGK